MEGIGHADMVVGLVRAFRHHHEGRHAGEVGLIGDGDQIEQQIDLFVEVVELADRTLGNLHAGDVGGRDDGDAPFDFPHALQILLEGRAIGGAQFALERPGAVQNQVEQAVGLAGVQDAFLGRGRAEQRVEDLLRVVLHRQRRWCRGTTT